MCLNAFAAACTVVTPGEELKQRVHKTETESKTTSSDVCELSLSKSGLSNVMETCRVLLYSAGKTRHGGPSQRPLCFLLAHWHSNPPTRACSPHLLLSVTEQFEGSGLMGNSLSPAGLLVSAGRPASSPCADGGKRPPSKFPQKPDVLSK